MKKKSFNIIKNSKIKFQRLAERHIRELDSNKRQTELLIKRLEETKLEKEKILANQEQTKLDQKATEEALVEQLKKVEKEDILRQLDRNMWTFKRGIEMYLSSVLQFFDTDNYENVVIDEFVFDDDILLTEEKRKKLENRGGSGILKVLNKGDLQIAAHNIILGLNIPNYPGKIKEEK